MNRIIYLCLFLLVLPPVCWTASERGTDPNPHLKQATISMGHHRSEQGPFEWRAVVGEVANGQQSNGAGPHQLIAGTILPNTDLIFKNNVE